MCAQKKWDVLALAVALAGLALFAPLFFAVPAVASFLGFGQTLTAVATLLSHLFPLSLCIDGVVLARKRKEEGKTLPALVIGASGIVIGLLLLANWAITVLF